MTTTAPLPLPEHLSAIAMAARNRFSEQLLGGARDPWWTAVILTASSVRQADRYRDEIQWRRERGIIPTNVEYLVVPDLDDTRIGSGGATLNALHVLAQTVLPASEATELASWWAGQRVFIIHAGGDSRRLPQFSLSGKIFSTVPVKAPWGDASTVFDELLVLSTAWVERMEAGLLVCSGDVVPTFDTRDLRFNRSGVTGVALPTSVEVGSQHGVYIVDDTGLTYGFLQKPTAYDIRKAGGLLPDGRVAVDSGILYFDASVSADLMALAGAAWRNQQWHIDRGIMTPDAHGLPVIDLYEHVTRALSGDWTPGPQDGPAFHQLAAVLHGLPFWCDLVPGDFAHIGTTRLFQHLMTEESDFTQLYAAQQRLGTPALPGVRSAGVVVDSVLAEGSDLGPATIVLECRLPHPLHAAHGAIMHGLTDLPGPAEVPAHTVLHQVPVLTDGGVRGTVMRVYGVADDPKFPITSNQMTWCGRPMAETLEMLGIAPEEVWPDIPAAERTLWNAQLFPIGSVTEVWAYACWMLGLAETSLLDRWKAAPRLSLASSALWADNQALAELRHRRQLAHWQAMAISLCQADSDIRPLLAHAPSVNALATTGRKLVTLAETQAARAHTEAASISYRASLFLGTAGLLIEAERARAAAFGCIRQAVEAGVAATRAFTSSRTWQASAVTVTAPARFDLGGGWSDTPPFCLDWGGTVLNFAVALHGRYPIRTTVRRIADPVIRCVAGEEGISAEFATTEEVFAPAAPGSPFSIPRLALQMLRVVTPDTELAATLRARGGGLEITTAVDLPMGSGLGTSSLLAATMLQALAHLCGITMNEADLSDQVMRLEQLMTTGGGWQDQAGGIFPGAKLVSSSPGLRQRLRVHPVHWSPEHREEFCSRMVLYYTGIRRIAKGLLDQVVSAYLARDTATVQVLHSIKTLAVEMSHALQEGEWDRLGALIDRHWQLNLLMDPHMTNAPINALLQDIRPFLAGAKPAGAGGGGFLLLLATSSHAARQLEERLAARSGNGAVFPWQLTDEGLHLEIEE